MADYCCGHVVVKMKRRTRVTTIFGGGTKRKVVTILIVSDCFNSGQAIRHETIAYVVGAYVDQRQKVTADQSTELNRNVTYTNPSIYQGTAINITIEVTKLTLECYDVTDWQTTPYSMTDVCSAL